ncbi:sensor histidine kinase [Lederbergia lenta]|uniref:Sensor histidine kinase n=1 Tax=Lederbergia lenta TaxID=1467 RepID=A0A2X4WCX2_LEDLE|nr:sensor histidine kinase [Lederbergia lenta]MCM3110304.1 sensor histidine kinase [Lederbergia lenta]MEC2324128.1 sensor histidine kinase [Lederbergia lenta]SQI60569.1 sensor histidine kinase [Lederbergia lenta]
MRTQKTFSIYFASATVTASLFVGIVLLLSIDANWYDALLQKKVFLIPSGIFILVTSILFGAVTGWIIGTAVHHKNEEIAASLLEIEQGNYLFDNESAKYKDGFIWEKIANISLRLKEQAQTHQKLASERVDWNNQLKEELLTKERNRLARELHDSVSQQLFAATMLLSAINQNPDPASDTAIKQRKLVEGVINEAQSEMRALLLHLRPIQLEGKSLKTGMEEILSELTSKLPMEVVWNIQDIKLDKGVEDHLFRILQEAVSNTLRHAKANRLEVVLKYMNRMVFLKIADNGKGFKMDSTKTSSYGLINMKERASEIGGNVKIVSIIGKGSSIEVKVPILMQKDEEND